MTRPEGLRRLADRLAPGAPELDAYKAALRDVDGRRSLMAVLSNETVRKYKFWLRSYLAWCQQQGYQPTLQAVTDKLLREYVIALTTGDRPYDPRSVKQALAALGHWVDRAAVDPMPSLRPAFDTLHLYMSSLEKEQVVVPRRKRAGRPTVEK